MSGTPVVTIHMTRVDAEVWHFDTVEVNATAWPDWDWAADDPGQKIEAAVREAFYEMGYVFDDDEPLERTE